MCALPNTPAGPKDGPPRAGKTGRDGSSRRRAEAERLSAQVGEMMANINRRYAGDTLAILAEASLTMAQMVTMHVLRHRGTLSVSGIAGCLRLSPPATSHLIDRLVQAGLVERGEDPEDRRAKRIVLTAKGRALVDRLQEERTREVTQVLSKLSAGVRRRFSDVLELVNRELSSLPEETKP